MLYVKYNKTAISTIEKIKQGKRRNAPTGLATDCGQVSNLIIHEMGSEVLTRVTLPDKISNAIRSFLITLTLFLLH